MKPFSLLVFVFVFLPLSVFPAGCGGSGRADGDTGTEGEDVPRDGDLDFDLDPDEALCTLAHCPVGPVCVSPTFLVTVTEEHDVCETQQCRGERRYCLEGCVDQPVSHCEGDVLDGDREQSESEPDEEFDLLDGDEDFEMPELMPCETLISYNDVFLWNVPIQAYGDTVIYMRVDKLHVFNISTLEDKYFAVDIIDNEVIQNGTIWQSHLIVGTSKFGRDPFFMFKQYDLNTGSFSGIQYDIPSDSYSDTFWIDGQNIAYRNIFRDGNSQVPGLLNLATGERKLLCDYHACELRGFSAGRMIWYDHSSSWTADSPNLSWDIYVYDIATGIKRNLTADRYAQDMPSIDGRYAVWTDCKYDDNLSNSPQQCDVFQISLYDFTSGEIRRVSDNLNMDDRNPWVSGSRVVWRRVDNSRGTNTAMLFDIATGKTYELFENGCYYRPYLMLVGDLLFYVENKCRTPKRSLYMYDLACHFARKGK